MVFQFDIVTFQFAGRFVRSLPRSDDRAVEELQGRVDEPGLPGVRGQVLAHSAMLAGVFRLSRQDVRRVVVEIFAAPASTGAIDNAIMRMSAVLADP